MEECIESFKEMVRENIKKIDDWKNNQDIRYSELVKKNKELLELK